MIASVIAFVLSPVGRWVAIGGIVMVAVSGIYLKGRSDGKASYQAKLTREINKSIAKGDAARTDALKKFDANKEIEDDGFARD
jgi:hypothetical protein